MAIPSPYITAQQAAEELGLSYSRIRQLLNEGRIKGAFKAPRDWLIPSPVHVLPRQGKQPSESRLINGERHSVFSASLAFHFAISVPIPIKASRFCPAQLASVQRRGWELQAMRRRAIVQINIFS